MIATLLLAWSTAPAAHPGPPVWLELDRGEGELVLTLSGEPEALAPCLGTELPLVGPFEEGVRERVHALFAGLFAEGTPLRVDGREAVPALRELELPTVDEDTQGWVFVHARYAFPLEQEPRAVSVTWTRYDRAVWMGETLVPLTLVRGRKVDRMVSLTPEEPEFVWHVEAAARPRPIPSVVVDRAVERRLPALSLALAGASVAAFAVLRRRASGPAPAAALAGGLLLAALLRDVGTLAVGAGPAVALPGPEQAERILETLQANVYDAFGAATEDEIYDLLAVSVDAALLDEVYGQVYESLVLRDQGGAVCSIEGVDVTERAVRFPGPDEGGDGRTRFLVDWTWSVRGLVSHWGHVHRRVNRYRATYTVAHDGASWKIAGVQVHEHVRTDPDAPEAGG